MRAVEEKKEARAPRNSHPLPPRQRAEASQRRSVLAQKPLVSSLLEALSVAAADLCCAVATLPWTIAPVCHRSASISTGSSHLATIAVAAVNEEGEWLVKIRWRKYHCG